MCVCVCVKRAQLKYKPQLWLEFNVTSISQPQNIHSAPYQKSRALQQCINNYRNKTG